MGYSLDFGWLDRRARRDRARRRHDDLPDRRDDARRERSSASSAPPARRSGTACCRQAIAVYVELVRNTPFLVQLFFIFFGLPASASGSIRSWPPCWR